MSFLVVSRTISDSAVVGFSGSRDTVPDACGKVIPFVRKQVVVGCANGVDRFIRQCFPFATVFTVSGETISRHSFVTRSVAFVRHLSSVSGLLVSFPSYGCPDGLIPSASPSRCFRGLGSGSWASLALAVGLGVSCIVYSPSGVPESWGFEDLGEGWFKFSADTLF